MKGLLLKKVFLFFISGLVFLAGCSGFSLREDKHRFTSLLPQRQIDSVLPPADRPAFNQIEPLQGASEPLSPVQDPSSDEVLLVAAEPIPGNEEILSFVAEEAPDAVPSKAVALSSGVAEENIPPAEPFSPATVKGLTAGEKKAHTGPASTSAPILRLPMEEEKSGVGKDAETLFSSSADLLRDANVRHIEGLDSLAGNSSSPLLSPSEMETPSKGKRPIPPLSAIFPPAFDEKKVEEYIAFFQQGGGIFFSNALARSQAYEDMMKKIFREKNLPEELFYLALIESGYNPHAISRAKAGGIWQFINKTAKRFGLKVNKWVDERRDPEKSTYAAAEYLKSLYEMFNCWDLAAAGYNAGEGKILRAMKKAKSQDFWEISQHRYLKKETKRYVPMFLAAVLIAKEPHKYGFSDINYHPPLVYEKVSVPPGSRLTWIAKLAETPLSEIRSLNPALRRERTPPGSSPFEIKLPSGKKEVFEKNLHGYSPLASLKGNQCRVRPGETLASIAKRYQVKFQDLCALNGLLPHSKIKAGAMLLLPP